MAMTATEIETRIRAALPDAEITISDLRGDGEHYAAHIVSAAFAGKTRVEQHKLVYDALRQSAGGMGAGGMGDALHALALQTVAK